MPAARLTSLALAAACLLPAAASAQPKTPEAAHGTISVSYLYMPPNQVEPTYHTAIWLEDQTGRLVKTLFVSRELSSTEFKMGDACPDWVKQAHWEKADPAMVDAVTGPTPNVGVGGLSVDVHDFGLAPGEYVFKLQVHIVDKYNILFEGPIAIGGAANDVALEVLYSPGKPTGSTDLVRDVRARYVPPTDKPEGDMQMDHTVFHDPRTGETTCLAKSIVEDSSRPRVP